VEDPIVFDHVWKKFRRGQRYNSLRDLVPALVKKALGRAPAAELNKEEFWAVRDVSFSVPPGAALGIIGPNGAGKSTTLKLLTRILRPNRGRCHVRGRVGALIEIAAGFHPDLTGIENIYLQGAIMGMKRAEIAKKLDEIIEFAGVRNFVETQVKRYSSGMNARLGFAIAAHLDPDVLIIDEVLSVGDMGFQRRCVERMEKFRRDGVAIVFVSHNLQAVASLCDRALYLNREVVAMGEPDDVIGKYVEALGSTATVTPGTGAKILAAELLHESGTPRVVAPGTAMTLRVQVEPILDLHDYTIFFRVHRSNDALLLYSGHFDARDFGRATLAAGEPLIVDFSFRAHLTRGHYHAETLIVHNPTQQILGRLSPAANFTVQESRTSIGIADLAVSASMRSPAASHGTVVAVGSRH
jgi:ABC-type polysaccharide/polyol phosphate transport system ATPase subunit